MKTIIILSALAFIILATSIKKLFSISKEIDSNKMYEHKQMNVGSKI